MDLKIVAVDKHNAFKHVWEVGDVVRIEAGDPAEQGVYQVTYVKGDLYGSGGMRWTYELALLRKEHP